MNDIRGGRVTSYMDDIRHSAVAEFRGGQVPGSNKLGQRPKGASWEIITRRTPPTAKFLIPSSRAPTSAHNFSKSQNHSLRPIPKRINVLADKIPALMRKPT
jgi:hypothetical protein